MGTLVSKFGGTSLADADQIRRVRAIVQDDPRRRFVVPSAPGKRFGDDQKITDLLYLCHAHATQRLKFDSVFDLVRRRFLEIVAELDLDLELGPVLDRIQRDVEAGASVDYTASRGEYLNGMILARLLGYEFADPADLIFFDSRGRLDEATTQQAVERRFGSTSRAVIPGFYGSTPDGEVKTFSRGGSDITGAIIARGVEAEVYENWTDVSGLLMTDPRIVDNPRCIDVISYAELRELAYMGASVLHDEAIFPVRQAGIPVNIRNTRDPSHPGTRIVSEATPVPEQGKISGIAGRRDFTIITVEKAMMNAELGFGRRLLNVLEVNGVSFEHMPTGIDTMSVVIASAALEGRLDQVLDQIRAECRPDAIDVSPDLALIATVGRGMARTPGMAARLFTAMAEAGVNIRMIDQGSSEINIIAGVETADFETAVRAIYHAFVDDAPGPAANCTPASLNP